MIKMKSKTDEKFKEIDKLMERNNKANRFQLDNAQIEPIDKNFLWASNGIYADIAVPGSGKSYLKMKMILQQEQLGDEPYFELVVYCSTSNGFDETVLAHKDSIKKSKLVFVKDTELLDWINKYLRRMLKYNSMMKYLLYDKSTEEMERVKEKHRLKNKKRELEYLSKKFIDYNWKTYPHRCLLILDDFASHPLVRTKESEMSRLLKKLRHFNITVNIIVQTAASLPKEIKRMLTDLVLFRGTNEEDFKKLFQTVPSTWNTKRLWELYKTLKHKRDKMILHLTANKIVIDRYERPIEILDDV